MRWLVGVLLAGSACVTPVTSQSYYRPTDPWARPTPAPRWYEAKPGDLYRPAWEYARSCSGQRPKSGGDYSDVKWLVVTSGSLRGDQGQGILGAWLAPDTIVLDSAWIWAPWLVAHELLHHLLHQPPNVAEVHPGVPFVWPCMLMFNQNVPMYAPGPVGSSLQLPPLLRFIGEGTRSEENEP